MGLETIWKKLRGQGSFEYILLLAGVLLIVVLAVVLLRGQSTGSGEGAAWQQCKVQLAQASVCYDPITKKWDSTKSIGLAGACATYNTDYKLTSVLACANQDKTVDAASKVCCGFQP